MKKYRAFLPVLIAIFVLAGCTSGGGPNTGSNIGTELSAVIGKLAAHYKNLDAGAMADMYTFPVVLIDEEGDSVTLNSRDSLKANFELGLSLFNEVHSATSVVSNSSRSGNSATAVVTMTVDATVLGIRSTETVIYEAKFQLVNGQWKVKQEKTLSTT